MSLRRTVAWGASLLLLCSAVFAQTPVPEREGLVLDQTEVLSQATVGALEQLLATYRDASGNEIAVLLSSSSGEEDLYDHAGRVIESWRLGGAEGRGALLLWSAQGTVLIRPGAAFEQRLPVETQVLILQRWVIPAFARGDADAGILAGVQQIMTVLAGAEVGVPPDAVEAPASADAAPVPDMAEDAYAASPPEPQDDFADHLSAEAERVIAGMRDDPWQTLRTLASEARVEVQQLPALVGRVIRQASAAAVDAPLEQDRMVVFAVLGFASGLGVMALLMRSAAGVMFVFPVFVAPLLWAATGFTGLSLALALAALSYPLLALLLRVLLQRPDRKDDRWAPRTIVQPGATKPRSTASSRPARAALAPARMRAASVAHASSPARMRAASVAHASRSDVRTRTAAAAADTKPDSGVPMTPLSRPFVRRLVQELIHVTTTGALDDLRRLKWWHYALGIGLLIAAPALLPLLLVLALGWLLHLLIARGGLGKALRALESEQDPAIRTDLARLRRILVERKLRL